MYLLNRTFGRQDYKYFSLFTFHYVSIKSGIAIDFASVKSYLHSTMYLLNPQSGT